MNKLIELDRGLFNLLNGILRADWLDAIAPYLRTPETWIPLYLFLIVFIIYRLRKTGILIVLVAGMTVGVADYTSSSIIKPAVERLRPCKDPIVHQYAVLLISCGSGYSFTSSHAANHFALSFFLILVCGTIFGRWRWLLLVWAALVSYAQIYVGVHFPFDILGGAILGTLLAWLGSRLFFATERTIATQ